MKTGDDPALEESKKILDNLINKINSQRLFLRKQRDIIWKYFQYSQILLIVASGVATAIVAWGIDNENIASWALIPTTVVTIITGISAFYDWRGEYQRLSELVGEMSALLSRTEMEISLAKIEENGIREIAGKSFEDYVLSVHAIQSDMLGRYEDERRSSRGREPR